MAPGRYDSNDQPVTPEYNPGPGYTLTALILSGFATHSGGTIFEMMHLLGSDLVRGLSHHDPCIVFAATRCKACRKLSQAVADERLSDRIKDMAEDLLQKTREADDAIQKEF